VSYLVSQGANVNAKDHDGRTPLHLTVGYGNVSVLEYIISVSADMNVKDNKGCTPLHIVAHFDTPSSVEVCFLHLLLDKYKGIIDVNAQDRDGYTPLDYANYVNNEQKKEALRKKGGKSREELATSSPQ
jgi:ankyrin repeat protein